MKKIITVAAITLLIVSMGATMAFADTPGRGNANGVLLHNTANSVEELLELKLARIDQLVEIGRLTEAQGAAFKALITERMQNCDQVGASREEHARLAIGFGRTNERGHQEGAGNQYSR